MGTFVTSDLISQINELEDTADAITDEQLKNNFENVIGSIAGKLSDLNTSLQGLAALIPDSEDYQIIDRYFFSFATLSTSHFINIVTDPTYPDYGSDLNPIYEEFLHFESVIDIINDNSDIEEIVRQIRLSQASGSTSQGQSTGPPPADYSNLFTFENEMTLGNFLKNFDDGIHKFNEKVKEYNDNKKEFNTLYEEVDDNIHKRQTEETIDRANILISEKVEYYESWIKFMYYLHRILLVILCIIIIITLVYKLI